ncbi:FK506-binding protein 5 [Vanessa cardui]|uniref:FK506-binding protein 5 n=1 Tax=Vanessa cardui TaxID=171605 RepID=UPI001F13CC47|nr:FK506-binding protein 5 [Vanessa cardui]
MNSKKGKTKNRPKPSKTSQNVDVVDTKDAETSNKADESEKCESLKKEEIALPELNIVSSPEVIEQPVVAASEAPKKPKRSKTKKKQDTSIEPITHDDLNTNTLKDDQKENIVETELQESVDVVPVARKKKTKSKKIVDQPKADVEPQTLECEVKTVDEKNTNINSDIIQKENPDAEPLKTSEVLQKETTVSKKKKKKKHRHDSDKSDINDPCTLAFQKLLESSEDVNEENESEKVSVDTIDLTQDTMSQIPVLVTESNQTSDLQENVKDGASKSKKKNKKGKKQPETESQINKDCKHEPEEDISNISTDKNITTENIELDTALMDLGLKPKAKIVKPVQKKRKAKSESQDENISESVEIDSENKINESTTQILNEPIMASEDKHPEKNTQVSEVSNISIGLIDDKKDSEDKVLSEKTDKIDKSAENSSIDILTSLEALSKSEDKNLVTEKTLDLPKVEEIPEGKTIIKTDSDKGSDNSGFVKVKTGKQKKKRQHNVDTVPEIIESGGPSIVKGSEINVPEQEIPTNKDEKETDIDVKHCDFVEHSPKHDELETLSIATPDLIQYPRSTSQQHIDDNNNDTIIEEISTTDEFKLGIPIYTATPIIQGSGESPDATNATKPIDIKVTEDTSPTSSSNEKNDIKSRIIEVNNDMEELRRSIERSLAELTGAEICTSEVDKEFEELFKNQIEDSQRTKPLEDKLQEEQSKSPDDNIMKSEKVSVDTVTASISKMDTSIETKSDQTNVSQPKSSEDITEKTDMETDTKSTVPICPARSKGKSKSKKKGKKETASTSSNNSTTQQSDTTNKDTSKTSKSNNSDKSDQKPESSKEKGKQQSVYPIEETEKLTGETDPNSKHLKLDLSFEPIENFEDALTSSADDVNKTFEIIVNEATESLRQNNPQINIIAPKEDTEEKNKEKKRKQNPASQPKNLLGKPNIPASSNKTDYKKEKNKPPNSIQAKVKIKDSVEIEKCNKDLKESHFDGKNKLNKQSNGPDTYSYLSNTNEDFIYKYSFRKVFLQSSCHVCKKALIHRFPCKFCSLVFYCSQKHHDEDWARHQFLCFAVSTIAHLKEQKHIYADAQNITGQDYRVLRMQMILSCEKILKRKLVPWEQEALLYPRLCADTSCRQWKQTKLKDCEGCGQISYCADHPDHLPSFHQRWCKSYALYQKLVNYQQTKGRLEPKLPTKVMEHYRIPDKINEVLGAMYEEKIDMDEIQYAALTQLASAPLTTAYGYQLYSTKMNSTCANGVLKKATFTIHAVGTDLQFEADALNKWEIFFLHLRPDVQDLRVVLVGPDLNPSELPLELLGKIKLCENCRANKRRVIFHFHDKETYHEYYSSDDFITPDVVCAFNPNIQRSSLYNIKDTWSSTIDSILQQKIPFIITSYNIEELERDISRVKEISRYNFNVVSEAKHNPFSSLRPDRNFITDHEIPLLFKNYCFSILCGAF